MKGTNVGTWAQLTSELRSRYKIAETSPNGEMHKLLFGLAGGRSQLIVVALQRTGSGREWVEISSPIGMPPQHQLLPILQKVEQMVCGGVTAMSNGVLTLRHSMPIGSMDWEDFISPFELIVNSADDLEREFVGGDQF